MKKFKKLIYIILFTSAIIWFVGFIIFNKNIHQFEIDNKKTDAIVVLTGGRNRISVAKDLFNKNLANKMFISGVSKEVSLKNIIKPEEVMVVYDKIEIGQEAKNTVENAIEIDEWVTKNNISSIRVVTSNYHMPRSIEEIKNKNSDVEIIIHPVFSSYVSKQWWRSWKSFKFIASEYNKFLFACAKNGIDNFIKG